MPSTSPGRGRRVVADTLSSSSGMRSRSERMSVPLPTPDGPVMTKTRATRCAAAVLAAQLADELGALALRQAADGLARRDPALHEDLVHLHTPVLRDGEEHVEHLRREDVLGRVEQERLDRDPTGFQVLLQLRAAGAG